MPLFRVIIHGRNFRLKLEEKWEKVGFYTPRIVEAPDAVLAEQVALEDFRLGEKGLELSRRSLNAEDDPPTLCGEEIKYPLGKFKERSRPVWHSTANLRNERMKKSDDAATN